MKWNDLLNLVAEEPVFDSALLMAGKVSRAQIQTQLTRWTRTGKILKLRKGLYVLAEPYGKTSPHPFLTANRLKQASYVSLQSALSHYGLIPEHVPVVTSVTTGRPERISTPLGRFSFRHIKPFLFNGYQSVQVQHDQSVFLGTPEKSLLDLVYLTPGGDSPNYLQELRLQHLDRLNLDALGRFAGRTGSRKLQRAAKRIIKLAASEKYEEL